MTRNRIVLVGGLAVVVLVAWAAIGRSVLPLFDRSASPSASPPLAAVASASPDAQMPSTAPTEVPSRAPTLSPSPPSATPATDPPPEAPRATAAPEAPGAADDSREWYVAFLKRLDDARADVQGSSETLVGAAEAGDQAAVRAAAVDILQFADRERDWLLAHPPADCYASAHASAGMMLEAYATVAERAIDWVDADGLQALDALAGVLVAASEARATLGDLAGELEATTCPR